MAKRPHAAATVSIGARAASIDFTTFVPSSAIGAVEDGDTSTIAFNYAGNKFVGSVYFDNQLTRRVLPVAASRLSALHFRSRPVL
jgi:hypothetical protein